MAKDLCDSRLRHLPAFQFADCTAGEGCDKRKFRCEGKSFVTLESGVAPCVRLTEMA